MSEVAAQVWLVTTKDSYYVVPSKLFSGQELLHQGVVDRLGRDDIPILHLCRERASEFFNFPRAGGFPCPRDHRVHRAQVTLRSVAYPTEEPDYGPVFIVRADEAEWDLALARDCEGYGKTVYVLLPDEDGPAFGLDLRSLFPTDPALMCEDAFFRISFIIQEEVLP